MTVPPPLGPDGPKDPFNNSPSSRKQVPVELKIAGGKITFELTQNVADEILEIRTCPLDSECISRVTHLVKKLAPDSHYPYPETLPQKELFWAIENFSNPALNLTPGDRDTLKNIILDSFDDVGGVILPSSGQSTKVQHSSLHPTSKNTDALEGWWYLFVYLGDLQNRLEDTQHIELIDDIFKLAVSRINRHNGMGNCSIYPKDFFESGCLPGLQKQCGDRKLVGKLWGVLNDWEELASAGNRLRMESWDRRIGNDDDFKSASSGKIVRGHVEQRKLTRQLYLFESAVVPNPREKAKLWDFPVESLVETSKKTGLAMFEPVLPGQPFIFAQDKFPNAFTFQLEYLRAMGHTDFKDWAIAGSGIRSLECYLNPYLEDLGDHRTLPVLLNQIQDYLSLSGRNVSPLRTYLLLPQVEEPHEVTQVIKFWEMLRDVKEETGAQVTIFHEGESKDGVKLSDWFCELQEGHRQLYFGHISPLIDFAKEKFYGSLLKNAAWFRQLTAKPHYHREHFDAEDALEYVVPQIAESRGLGDYFSCAIPIDENHEILSLADTDLEIERHFSTDFQVDTCCGQYIHAIVVTSEFDPKDVKKQLEPDNVNVKGPLMLV